MLNILVLVITLILEITVLRFDLAYKFIPNSVSKRKKVQQKYQIYRKVSNLQRGTNFLYAASLPEYIYFEGIHINLVPLHGNWRSLFRWQQLKKKIHWTLLITIRGISLVPNIQALLFNKTFFWIIISFLLNNKHLSI